jgi:hypothetical protein
MDNKRKNKIGEPTSPIGTIELEEIKDKGGSINLTDNQQNTKGPN